MPPRPVPTAKTEKPVEISAEFTAFLQVIDGLKKLSVRECVDKATDHFRTLVKRDEANVAIIDRLREDLYIDRNKVKVGAEQLDELGKKVEEYQEKISTANRELEERRKEAEDYGQRLREETAKVMRLEQYRVELNAEPQDIGDRWGGLWTRVNELATEFFSRELDREMLRAASGWEPVNAKNIPFPATNSLEAKQMRIIIVDSIIASALTEHIFRPVGVDKEFDKNLSQLARTHPDMESFYRASHLAVLDQLPVYRNRIINQAVKAAITDIIRSVSRILPPDMAQLFCIGLEDVCTTAAQEWRIFQQYTERYEVDLAGNEDWHDLAPLWQPDKTADSPRTNSAAAGKQNGQSPNQSGARRNKRGEGSSSSPPPLVEGRPKPGTVVACVWPLLKVVGDNGAVVKLQGLALFSSQTQDAEEQVKRASRQEKRDEGKQGGPKSSHRPQSLVPFLPSSPKAF